MIKRVTFLCLTLVTLFLTMSVPVEAVPVVNYTNTYDAVSDVWTYEASIFNDTTDLLYDFVIYPTVQPLSASDLTSEGWLGPDMGSDFVHWMADFGYEILPGDTMSGFWFTYSGGIDDDIGSLGYEVALDSESGPYVLSVASAASVPEPGTMMLLGSGLFGIAVFRKMSGHWREG